MLKALRNQSIKKKIFMALAVVVIAGFLVSMIVVSNDDSKASSSLAQLNGRKITVQEYLDSYRAVMRQAEWIYGSRLNEIRGQINFKGEAWDRLLLLDHAKKEKIKVSDEEVVALILSQEAFQSNGKFDEKYYKIFVERSLRSNPRAFEEDVRKMLTIQKLSEKKRETLSPSDEEVKEAYAAEKSEKTLLVALLSLETFKDKGDQAEAEMLKKTKEIQEKLKTGDFEAVLVAEGLKVETVEKYKKGVYPMGIFPSDNLEKALTGLKENEITDFFVVPKGAMVAKVTHVTALDEKIFADEKEAFQKDLATKKMSKEMQELLEGLRKNLVLNLPLMKEIFPSEPDPSVAADAATPPLK